VYRKVRINRGKMEFVLVENWNMLMNDLSTGKLLPGIERSLISNYKIGFFVNIHIAKSLNAADQPSTGPTKNHFALHSSSLRK
jgi:hypothetical protein